MDLNGNNINGEIARKRDIFLKAEKEYLEELKKDPKNREMIQYLNNSSASVLSKEAEKRIDRIENGKVEFEQLERVEAEIALIYAAIQDKIRERVRERVAQISKNSKKDNDYEMEI